MKEISYVHAQAYAAGELKHGANALLGAGLPVVALAPRDALHPKMFSSIGECTARGSPVTVALQLFAYHSADLRGCSTDRPRNLAKRVTVE
jgi:glucosamine--fructose-6-phosphate aminotransferase (isomerizing)